MGHALQIVELLNFGATTRCLLLNFEGFLPLRKPFDEERNDRPFQMVKFPFSRPRYLEVQACHLLGESLTDLANLFNEPIPLLEGFERPADASWDELMRHNQKAFR